jgi:RNA polymerase sigma factor (sigma-70 family)
MTPEKEKSRLGKARQGDVQAFGEVIERYQSLVYAVALQIVRDRAAAQDVTQETFITAFESLKDLRSEASFPSWLRTITRNTALLWRKERDRISPFEQAGELQSSPDLSKAEVQEEQREAEAFRADVWRIVSSLSDKLRFPILLCYMNDIPTAEAARFLGIREGTLRKRLHDGKKRLQGSIVKMAEQTLQEYRLPRGFTRRCICGCQRGRSGRDADSTSERR